MWKHTLTVGAVIAGLAAGAAAQPHERGQKFLDSLFERIDTDVDGVISAAEIERTRLTAFQTADANADGVVDSDEIDALKDADVERPPRPQGRFRGRKGDGEGRDPMARLDANADGLITQDEFVDRPMRVLEFDADGDGAVTQEEVREGMRARMAERRAEPSEE